MQGKLGGFLSQKHDGIVAAVVASPKSSLVGARWWRQSPAVEEGC